MNNLKELFEIQGGLDSEINKKHPKQEGEDRLGKKHVALLVELGEMFNEFRRWKFWSFDKNPRTAVICKTCGSWGEIAEQVCSDCSGKGERDLVLEELVDCLHFVLGIGLEMIEIHPMSIDSIIEIVEPYLYPHQTIEEAFIDLIRADWVGEEYEELIGCFIGFSERLGYTWEEVTAAYLEKNQENHMRLLNGY